jgi:DNA-binding response OmpR family regulator
MNGFRVLEIIRADPGLRGLGVLMLTGCHSANNVARAASLSINDYLVKPVSPSLLWRRTKALLKPAHDWPERETPNSTCSDN